MIIDLLKEYAKNSVQLKHLVRWYRSKTGHPDWGEILSREKSVWEAALKKAKNGPKILIATSVGGHLPGTTLESLLAVALTLRGAEVHILLCDAFLPACLESVVNWYPNQVQFVRYGSADLCRSCFRPADTMYRSLSVPVHRYSDFITTEEILRSNQVSSNLPLEEIEKYTLDGVAIGEHAVAGALRFYARGTLDNEPHADGVLRRFFNASLLTTYLARRLFSKISFECATFHHGIYVPQGLIGEVARREKVRVVNWNPAYRKKCFIFSHNDTYHHTLMTEPVERWENIKWTSETENELMKYLKSRWQGTEDWIWFHERPEVDLSAITHEVGIDFTKPCIGMLTNVMWDAQLHYPANAFPNMLEWVLQTIEYFSKRPDLQLLIRIHPAEIRGTLVSRQPILTEIKKAFPTLPKNVFVIPPESQVSTYAAMSQCNAVIIYGTKTGVELTSMGIPVIVAGEAWIRNKGLTFDAKSAGNYFSILDKLPLKSGLDEETKKRARKYAYHFFFRRMIPLNIMEPTKGWPPFKLGMSGLTPLKAGSERGLDVICDGILNGTDFIYPSEEQ